MSKIQLNYYKPKKIALDNLKGEGEYNPFEIEDLQLYHPLYKSFFTLNENNYDAIALNHRFHMTDLTTVWDMEHSETA